MINLDQTDNLEGLASVTNVVEFTFSGVDGTTVVSKEGKLTTSQTTIHTATGIVRAYGLTLYNSHSAAVTVTISKDPGDAGTLYRIFSISLGIGYTALFDGSKLSIIDTNGVQVSGLNVSDTAYAASWDGATTIAPSKNAVYDKLQLMVALFPTVLGAANLKQFMNAAGTAPEWAKGIKIITLTRDLAAVGAPTDVETAGVGFKPSLIRFDAAMEGDVVGSFGSCDGTEQNCIPSLYTSGAWYGNTGRGEVIYAQTGASDLQSAVWKSFDADGFTLTWTKVGTPTGYLYIMATCFR